MKNQSFLKRLGFAYHGIRIAFIKESSFRFQCFSAVCVILTLIFFKAQPIWWAIFLMTIGSILSAELFNTALEHLIDHLHPAIHPLIKISKDCASGAVLVLSFMSIGIFIAFLCESV